MNEVHKTEGFCFMMAAEVHVKSYVACWLQLGKKVWIRGGQEALHPQTILQGDRYSPEFEACWQRILNPESGDCYLDGTNYTIQDLLTHDWEMVDCARCSMPVPVKMGHVIDLTCPCHNLSGWPNNELPPPRTPVDSQTYLEDIRQRLSRG